MVTNYPDIGSRWCDQHGHVVIILDLDIEDQKVVYQRPGYEWKCAAPLIVFRAIRVAGEWVQVNHSFAEWVVGDFISRGGQNNAASN